jgi:branched-chain amino acid transport system substrate-binding protein
MPVEDFMTNSAKVREDGYLMRDFYLFRVKTPEESKGEWDLLEPLETIPAAAVAPELHSNDCGVTVNN